MYTLIGEPFLMKSKTTKIKLSSIYGKNNKGAAIVLVTFIVLILMIAGLSLLHLSYNSQILSVRFSEDLACKICADSGLQKALGEMNLQLEAGTLNDDDLPMSIGETIPASEGVFSYNVIKNDEGDYVIYSIGARGNFRRTIMATLGRSVKSYFDYGILTTGIMQAGVGMTISGYNPLDPNAPLGTYPVAVGSIGTNPSDVRGNGIVYGDIFCGVGGDPAVVIDGLNATGTKYALSTEQEITIPVMPTDIPAYGTDYIISGETITLTPSDSGIYPHIKVTTGKGKPSIVYIDGGTVTLGSQDWLIFSNDCEIRVKEGSTLLLYVGGCITSGTGASMTYEGATPDPTHIQVYGTNTTSQPWTLKSKDMFTGVIYAPHSDVSIDSSGTIIGAVVSQNFYGNNGVQYMYDISLKDATNIALSGPSDFTIKRWTELDRGEVPDWAQ
jgi:hypothetical protein